jgi:two-component system, cell cycle response regulator
VRVLVVEDNPTNLELMSYLLKAFGHEAIAASSGAEGLRHARSQPPDIVVCDIQMHGVDGFDVLAGIRADEQLRDVPVVAVTASAMVGDRENALAAGFDGYISKPIDPETFVQSVIRFAEAGRR